MPRRQGNLESAEVWNFLRVIFSFPDSNYIFSHLLAIIHWVKQVKCIRTDGILRWVSRKNGVPPDPPSLNLGFAVCSGILVSVIYMVFVMKISFWLSLILYKSQKMRAESEGIPPDMYLVLYQSMGGLSVPTYCSSFIFLAPFIGPGLSNAQSVLPD